MPWPSVQDYYEAIQSPSTCFAEPDLRAGAVECDRLGLPRPRSGGFATVYKLISGSRSWAVKCFSRELKDQEQRYAAISSQLTKSSLACMVDFSFLQRGIRVKGQWFPTLKMEWVAGELLNDFITRNLQDRMRLRRLAEDWVRMLKTLSAAGVAHGDLQDGNVLVVGNGLKLVDYDGMYVPAMHGWRSNETGQPNYQHPHRTALDFGPHLDNFSGWVVLVSLIAISNNPGLWERFQGGGQCVLFRRRDFEAPEQSALFNTLEKSSDGQLCGLVTLIKTFLYSPLERIPTVDGSALATIGETSSSTSQLDSSWIEDHISSAAGAADASPVTSRIDQSAHWVLDFATPLAPVACFQGSFARQRAMLLLSVLVAVVAGLVLPALSGILIGCAIILFSLALLRHSYDGQRVVREFRALAQKLSDGRAQLASANREMSERAREGRAIRANEKDQREKLLHDKRSVQNEEMKTIKSAKDAHERRVAPHLATKQSLDQREASDLTELQNTTGRRITDLKHQIAALGKAEADGKATVLKASQERFVHNILCNARVLDATIPGIGDKFKLRLYTYGFKTAADIDYYRVQSVPGVGDSRAGALVAWKAYIESEARNRMPKSLPRNEDQQVTSKYANLRVKLQADLSSEQNIWMREEHAIRQQCAMLKQPIEAQLATEQLSLLAELNRITANFKRRQDYLDEQIQAVAGHAATALKEFQDHTDETGRKLSRAQWNKGTLERQLTRYRTVRFPRYLSRVLLGM